MPRELDVGTALSAEEAEVLAAAIRDEAARQRRGIEHPEPDELLAYAEGTLKDDDKDRLQEHLTLCPTCAEAVLDLADFPAVELAEPQGPPSEFEVAAAWRRFREVTAPEKRLARPAWALRGVSALAAALLAAVVGLSFWVQQLRRQVDEPRVNVYVGDLMPEAAGGERGEADRIEVPAEVDRLLLLLNLADFREFDGYRAEIADPEGRMIWSSEALRRGPDGNFTVELNRRFLAEGTYQIEVQGLSAGTRTPLARYRMEIGYL